MDAAPPFTLMPPLRSMWPVGAGTMDKGINSVPILPHKQTNKQASPPRTKALTRHLHKLSLSVRRKKKGGDLSRSLGNYRSVVWVCIRSSPSPSLVPPRRLAHSSAGSRLSRTRTPSLYNRRRRRFGHRLPPGRGLRGWDGGCGARSAAGAAEACCRRRGAASGADQRRQLRVGRRVGRGHARRDVLARAACRGEAFGGVRCKSALPDYYYYFGGGGKLQKVHFQSLVFVFVCVVDVTTARVHLRARDTPRIVKTRLGASEGPLTAALAPAICLRPPAQLRRQPRPARRREPLP